MWAACSFALDGVIRRDGEWEIQRGTRYWEATQDMDSTTVIQVRRPACGFDDQHTGSMTTIRLTGSMTPRPPVRQLAAPASPFQRDVGRLILTRRRNWGARNTRGDPGSGRPVQCVTKTNHDLHRGSYFPLTSPSYARCLLLTPG